MAYTKVHGIKVSLKKALDYIMDSEKTEGQLLVTGVNCTPATAHQEFRLEHAIATNKGKDSYSKKDDILAKHMIQSFKKDEVTAEQAHQIGLELAEQMFKGKYQYVVTTHVDKDNIHNHIMVNVTNLETHNKIRDTELNWLNLWMESNKLCQKYDLSWNDPEAYCKSRGQKFYEWQHEKAGMSYKAQLQQAIDEAILQAENYEDLLKSLHQRGYLYIKKGNTVSFKREGQKYGTRLSKLGSQYTEQKIAQRIAAFREAGQDDLQSSISKTAERSGRYGSSFELKRLAATIAVLQQNDIHSYDIMEIKIAEVESDVEELKETLQQIKGQMDNYDRLAEKLELYQKLKPVADQYKKAIVKKTFYNKHSNELDMFQLLEAQLKEAGVDVEKVSLAYVLEKKNELKEREAEIKNNYKTAKDQLYELNRTYDHIRRIMNEDKEQQLNKGQER